MTYFNYVDISASFKNFRQKLHLLVFVIIKLAMLLRFTNPSKQSTFNVRLVPDKNFRMIASTFFQVARRVNKLVKIFINYWSYFPQFYYESYQICGDVGFR